MTGSEYDRSIYVEKLQLGIDLFHAGKIDAAMRAFAEAADLGGAEVGAHINLARILSSQGRSDEGQEWLRRAERSAEASAEGLFEIGQAWFDGRAYREAARLFAKSVALAPAYRLAGLQLVAALLNAGEIAEAHRHLEHLAAQFPADLEVLRTKLMVSRGKPELSLPVARAILGQSPDDADALRELALSSTESGEKETARTHLHVLCRRTPGDIEGWKALAASVSEDEGYNAIVDILEEGITLTDDPALRLYRAMMLPKVPWSNAEIDVVRAKTEHHLDAVIARAGNRSVNLRKVLNRLPYRLAYHGRNDRPLMEKFGRAHLAIAPDLAWTSPHLARPQTPRPKIRVGFLSAFFENHSVGKMIRKVIEDLSRDYFEVVVLRVVPAIDDIARAIDRSADAVVVLPQHLPSARARIAEADLDVLVFTDIGMEAFSYYLAFARLARRQVVWPGHPVTTGLSTIDAYISSAAAEPTDAQKHYTEKLVKFSACPIYEVGRPVKDRYDFRSKFKLPAGPLYVCAMTEQKFHPDFDVLLRAIFDRDPHANFVMVGRGDTTTSRVQRRLLENVPALAGRLFTLPWLLQTDFSNLMMAADANLDTPRFGGSGTSRDAAALGAVVVSFDGEFMRGRQTTGMYRDMGLQHLVLATAEQYVDFAVRIANDADYRTRLEAEVREAAPLLVLRKQVLADFENFFASVGDGA